VEHLHQHSQKHDIHKQLKNRKPPPIQPAKLGIHLSYHLVALLFWRFWAQVCGAHWNYPDFIHGNLTVWNFWRGWQYIQVATGLSLSQQIRSGFKYL